MCAAEWNDKTSVVARVADLLGAYTGSERGLGVSELARRTGLPKSTVHRLASELVAHRFLERQGVEFGLGLRLFEIGARAARQRNLRDVALPFMADLREATRQTVQLAVLEGSEVVYVEILREKSAPRLPSRVGGRLPAHATAVGKAILAFSPANVVDEVIRNGLTQLGPRTTVVPALLRQQLSRVRAQGVAVDCEEAAAGLVCASSPILRDGDTPVAAISISGWMGKLNPRRMAPAVLTAALAISRELGPVEGQDANETGA